jgi:hypothetical protein
LERSRDGRTQQQRRNQYSAVSKALQTMSDSTVTKLVRGASTLGTGIGGTVGVVSLHGTKVFLKVIPLTELEGAAENIHSTANLFLLPAWCHYGIGSPGMGVWRELAAHVASTQWVLDGRCESFPMTYHWRVLPLPAFPGSPPSELADVDHMVAFWENSSAVRARLHALLRAPRSVVLFCEYIPHTLGPWPAAEVRTGQTAADAAISMVDTSLRAAISFFNAHRWMHFDAHFGNVLTDGHIVYLSDFGLSASTDFELSADERTFLRANATHDRCYVVTELANFIAREIAGHSGRQERISFLRWCADGHTPMGIRGMAATLVHRYAPIAVVMNDFYGALYSERRTVPYPGRALDRVLTETGVVP